MKFQDHLLLLVFGLCVITIPWRIQGLPDGANPTQHGPLADPVGWGLEFSVALLMGVESRVVGVRNLLHSVSNMHSLASGACSGCPKIHC